MTWYPDPDDAALAARAVEEFHAAHGREPDGVWAAPGRVNLVGEHVDYNGGLCLPMALPHKTFVALGLRSDDRVHLVTSGGSPWQAALGDVAPGSVRGWAGYAVGVAWALGLERGFDAAVVGGVPMGAGLSSSAALECAVALALDDLCALGLGGSDAGRATLAAACVRAENEIAGAPTGGMDQAASLRGRAGHALLLDCTDFSARQVPFDAAAAGLVVLVIDTKVHHALVDGQYGSRRDVCEAAAALLGVGKLGEVAASGLPAALGRLEGDEQVRRVRHVVTEVSRVREAADVLDAGRFRDLGPIMDASHASLRDDYEVSCTELDVACAAAREAGALGARMTGGGFGGSAIALVEAAQVEAVVSSVSHAFSRNDFAEPAFLSAIPSGPGHRVTAAVS